MKTAEARLSSHLVEDESIQCLTSGRLLEDPSGEQVAVGLSDRRLLCVSESGEFTDVRYDYVSSITSRQRTSLQFETEAQTIRTVGIVGGIFLLGGVLTGLGELSAGSGISDAITVLISLGTVAAAVIVERSRRADGITTSRRQLLVGTGLFVVAVLATLALVMTALSTSLYVVAVTVAAVVAWTGLSNWDQLTAIGLRSRPETEITVTTVDGQRIDVVVDGETDVDRRLSTSIYRDGSPSVDLAVADARAR